MSAYKTKSRPKVKSMAHGRKKTRSRAKYAAKQSHAGLIFVIVFLVLLVGAYGAAGFYFSQHFLPGTTLNNSDVSLMTLGQAKETLLASSRSYKLTLVEQDFKKEVIDGSDIGLEAYASDSFDSILDLQSGLEWLFNIFKQNDIVLENGTITYSYDKDMLYDIVDELDCVSPQYPIEAKDAEIVLLDGKFAIVPESVGNTADKQKLIEIIGETIDAQGESIDLEERGLYNTPSVYADDPDLNAHLDLLDNYNDMTITLKFGPKNVLIDVKTISGWISAAKQSDGSFKIAVNDDKISEYVKNLASTYDTYDKTKIFHSHAGNVVELTTGDYGWKLDQEAAVAKLKELVQKCQTVAVDLTGGDESSVEWWSRMAVGYDDNGNDDYGTTYAEVSISEQHMWLYQNGAVTFECDVVTGNPNLGNSTPQGAFHIRYHQKNAVLRGPGYATPVAYWMVFADDVGFHDATWQPYFGGSLYQTNGSHGCVNMPLDKAGVLYDLIYDGMPVFVY